MPLSDHEQRILDEIERRLSEDDPRFVKTVGRANPHVHAAKRMRLGVFLFIVGFIMLLLFPVDSWGQWAATAGFGVMLASALLVYHYLKQMGREQLQALAGLDSRCRLDRSFSPSDSAEAGASRRPARRPTDRTTRPERPSALPL